MVLFFDDQFRAFQKNWHILSWCDPSAQKSMGVLRKLRI